VQIFESFNNTGDAESRRYVVKMTPETTGEEPNDAPNASHSNLSAASLATITRHAMEAISALVKHCASTAYA